MPGNFFPKSWGEFSVECSRLLIWYGKKVLAEARENVWCLEDLQHCPHFSRSKHNDRWWLNLIAISGKIVENQIINCRTFSRQKMSHLASTMATHLPLLFFNLPKCLVKVFCFADKKIWLISKVNIFVVLPPDFCVLHVPFSLSSIFQNQCSLAAETAYLLNLENKFCQTVDLVIEWQKVKITWSLEWWWQIVLGSSL